MKNSYIGVLDSGVGGLSVLKKLVKSFPKERFVYFGDNLNAPYGEKSVSELLHLAVQNALFLQNYNIKALVLACNTLSLTVLEKVKDFLNIPVFGVFPPVEREILSKRKTLLLATPRTCSFYKENEYLTVYPLKDLAREIESNLYNVNSINVKSVLPFYSGQFDSVILGCTHYEFVKNKIYNHLKPLLITDGTDFTIKKLIDNGFLSDNCKIARKNQVKFVGENKFTNEKFWFNVVKRL